MKLGLLLKIIICIAICLGLGFFSGYYSGSAVTDWYTSLNKPFFQPPPWVFGPAWSVLYTLIGIALALVWHASGNEEQRGKAIRLFAFQLLLNLIWSPVFFKFQNPPVALGIIILMIFMILMTLNAFNKIDRRASLLMLPYLCWVCFATLLNGAIVYLN